MAHIDDAKKKGVTVLAGGNARPDIGPYFVEPTVLTDVTADMKCATAETFGPVVAVQVVDSEDSAVIAANASEYGLNGSVISRSRSRARRVALRLNAGSVNVNEGYRASFGSVDAPQGGVKPVGTRPAERPGGAAALRRGAHGRRQHRSAAAADHRPRVVEDGRSDAAAAAHPEGRAPPLAAAARCVRP